MTIFETTFRDLLIAANLVESRVFFWKAPQVPAEMARTPYAIFFQIAPDTSAYPQGGPLTLLDRDYQLSIFDPSQSKAVALADSFRLWLDGFRGTFGNVRFGSIRYGNQTSSYEPETQLFQIIQEYRIQYHLLLDPAVQRSTKTATR